MPLENKIPWFHGGNIKQRNHLDAMVDRINAHEDAIDELRGDAPRNPLIVTVPNADNTRLMQVEIDRANIIADIGPNRAPLMPWQPYITGIGVNAQKRATSVTLKINPESTLWASELAWSIGGSNWDNNVTPTDFASEITITEMSHIVWLEVAFVGALKTFDSAQILHGSVWSGWPRYLSDPSLATVYVRVLLAYFRETRSTERPDLLWQDGKNYRMITPVTTHLRAGITREDGGSGSTNDQVAVYPWFRTYEAT